MSTGIVELQDEMVQYAKREANGQTQPAQPSAYQHGRSKRDDPDHGICSYDCNPMPRQRRTRLCLATGKAGQIDGASQVAQSERASQHDATGSFVPNTACRATCQPYRSARAPSCARHRKSDAQPRALVTARTVTAK